MLRIQIFQSWIESTKSSLEKASEEKRGSIFAGHTASADDRSITGIPFVENIAGKRDKRQNLIPPGCHIFKWQKRKQVRGVTWSLWRPTSEIYS